jgi:hypothetical protein
MISCIGRALAHAVVDTDTGEVLASANDELTEELLEKLRAAKVNAFRTHLHQRFRSWAATSRKPCASMKPWISWLLAWPSTA